MGTGSFPGAERPGRDADPSPPSSAVGNERVELYLYSPYGPYGLYRASVPVQGCTLPFYIYRSTLVPQINDDDDDADYDENVLPLLPLAESC